MRTQTHTISIDRWYDRGMDGMGGNRGGGGEVGGSTFELILVKERFLPPRNKIIASFLVCLQIVQPGLHFLL